MKTAEDILESSVVLSDAYDKHFVLKAMKEVAGLAFDAGDIWHRDEHDYLERGIKNESPTKKQFLSQLFPACPQ